MIKPVTQNTTPKHPTHNVFFKAWIQPFIWTSDLHAWLRTDNLCFSKIITSNFCEDLDSHEEDFLSCVAVSRRQTRFPPKRVQQQQSGLFTNPPTPNLSGPTSKIGDSTDLVNSGVFKLPNPTVARKSTEGSCHISSHFKKELPSSSLLGLGTVCYCGATANTIT